MRARQGPASVASQVSQLREQARARARNASRQAQIVPTKIEPKPRPKLRITRDAPAPAPPAVTPAPRRPRLRITRFPTPVKPSATEQPPPPRRALKSALKQPGTAKSSKSVRFATVAAVRRFEATVQDKSTLWFEPTIGHRMPVAWKQGTLHPPTIVNTHGSYAKMWKSVLFEDGTKLLPGFRSETIRSRLCQVQSFYREQAKCFRSIVDPSFVEVKQSIPGFYGRRVDDKTWRGFLLKHPGERGLPDEAYGTVHWTDDGIWLYRSEAFQSGTHPCPRDGRCWRFYKNKLCFCDGRWFRRTFEIWKGYTTPLKTDFSAPPDHLTGEVRVRNPTLYGAARGVTVHSTCSDPKSLVTDTSVPPVFQSLVKPSEAQTLASIQRRRECRAEIQAEVRAEVLRFIAFIGAPAACSRSDSHGQPLVSQRPESISPSRDRLQSNVRTTLEPLLHSSRAKSKVSRTAPAPPSLDRSILSKPLIRSQTKSLSNTSNESVTSRTSRTRSTAKQSLAPARHRLSLSAWLEKVEREGRV